MCLGEKVVYYKQALFRGVVVLLAVSSAGMNQQDILNKVSLNRNTDKQGYVLITQQYISLEAMVPYSLSVHGNVQNTMTTNNMN